MTRRLLTMLGWLLTVMAASAVGLLPISLLAGDLTGSSTTPLSSDAVADALASASASRPAAPTTPTAPASSSPHDIGKAHSLSSPGGTLIARCDGADAYLVSWTPAQGWEVEDHVRGPAPSTMVVFEGDSDSTDDRQITVTVTCRSGRPVAARVTTAE